jgi:hypothetical protein
MAAFETPTDCQVVGSLGGKGGGGGRGEKWTKPCMHIWIIKEKWKKKKEG